MKDKRLKKMALAATAPISRGLKEKRKDSVDPITAMREKNY